MDPQGASRLQLFDDERAEAAIAPSERLLGREAVRHEQPARAPPADPRRAAVDGADPLHLQGWSVDAHDTAVVESNDHPARNRRETPGRAPRDAFGEQRVRRRIERQQVAAVRQGDVGPVTGARGSNECVAIEVVGHLGALRGRDRARQDPDGGADPHAEPRAIHEHMDIRAGAQFSFPITRRDVAGYTRPILLATPQSARTLGPDSNRDERSGPSVRIPLGVGAPGPRIS
jgi:hypothetical protein